jgi:catechol 2,3-dioxygenase-like lactoylglutathione lyase family enzyme
MTEPDIAGIAPLFIVKNVPAALSFYRERLGFDITFQGPDPDDIFFGVRCPERRRDVRRRWTAERECVGVGPHAQ